MVRFEYWAHSGGENYLVRLSDANIVTGVCGPMRQAHIPAVNLHNYDYDSQPQHTAWVQQHTAEFHNITSDDER